MTPRALGWWLYGPAAVWVGGVACGLAWLAWNETRERSSLRPASETQSGPGTAIGSDNCRRCHTTAHASWRATYHRTMTQVAEGAAVAAPFAGESFDYLGFRAVLSSSAAGVPHVRITALSETRAPEARGTDEVVLDADVVLTVGSHRYQQYVAYLDRGGGPRELWRLPVAWHLGERRWIHMNGAFVEPDGTSGNVEDYLRHLSRWNDNCIFCHNTEPRPGKTETGTYESEVAELGIACEACHGPASTHVDRQANPLRRVSSGTFFATGDPGHVVHPGRIDTERATEICGRCHGQRLAPNLERVLAHGDGFRPGRPLSEVSRPIFRDTSLRGGDVAVFADRFWPDGTPRLSAYEYQGLLLSSCHADAQGSSDRLGCNHCHSMHAADPAGQVRRDRQGSQACVGCHDPSQLHGVQDGRAHGGHTPEVTCLDCHMPRTTYGLLEAMRSHRITSPNPGALVGRSDQPDACTQCHVDRSRGWASGAMSGLGLSGSHPGEPSEEESWSSRVVLDLLGGDPLQRNLAADALGRPTSAGDPSLRLAALAHALEDEFASVRWFAWRGLRSLGQALGRVDIVESVAGYDYLADPADRLEHATRIRAAAGSLSGLLQPDRLERLEQGRDARSLFIGE